MARLPVPGSDEGVWGQLLNDYLSVEHDTDGSLKTTGSLAAKADDTAVVHKDDAQTISGAKDFTGGLTVNGSNVISSSDGRLSDARIPLDGSVTDAKIASVGLSPNKVTGTAITQSVVTAKGDVVVGTGNAAISRLPTGGDGLVLTADSTQSTGLKWGAVPAGATGPQGPPGMVWRGLYSNSTTYGTNDAVSYAGSSFIATSGVTGVAPGTSASPNAPWQTLAAAGPTGPAGPGGKSPDPSWVSMVGWTYDPMFIAATQSPTNGVIYLGKVYLAAGTVSTLYTEVGTGITSPTANANFAGLYSASGSRIAQTADQGTIWATTGVKAMALSSPVTVTEGFYYFALLVNGTAITFQRASSAGHYNNGAAASSLRTAAFGTSQTSLPTSITPTAMVATNVALWGGVA